MPSQDETEPIRILSLADNHLSNLRQLDRLPTALSHITALNLANNPIGSIAELSHIVAPAEKRGRATASYGGLKNLQELNLQGCKFREEMIAKPNGAETYQQ